MEICHNAAEELEYGSTLLKASWMQTHLISAYQNYRPYESLYDLNCESLITIAERTGGKANAIYMTCHEEGNFILHVEVDMPSGKRRFHSFTVNDSLWDAPDFRISRYTSLSQEAFEAKYA